MRNAQNPKGAQTTLRGHSLNKLWLSLTCPNLLVLQDYSVVDEADILGRVVGFGPLLAQEVQDASGQHSELAVLDELTQV